MPVKPSKLIDPPDADALSEVLAQVRLRGSTVLRCAPGAPFSITCPVGVRLLHIVEAGSLTLTVEGETFPLRTGDLVLLARGHEHTLHSGTAGPDTAWTLRPEDLFVDEVPPGHRPDRWLTGTFAVDAATAGPVLDVLPPAMIMRNTPRTRWLPLSTQLLVAEVSDPCPGAAVMISRILDLLFVHALRGWAREDTARTPGWLTAAADPRIALAIGAMHRDPAHPWSVTELAKVATLSRSTFAERFTALLGCPPAGYLTDVRLRRAADLLTSTTEPIGMIARAVGYTSDAAFVRAFTRRYGQPPGRWRRGRPSPDAMSGRQDFAATGNQPAPA
jgi:AraC-like DNA-binding protein